MELNEYQINLLRLLHQPEKPRFSVEDLRQHGIEYDRDEFAGLYSENYLRIERRGPQREVTYYIGPAGEKAVEDYLKEHTESEKADKFNSDMLEEARIANLLAKKANKKAFWANIFSLIAGIFSFLSFLMSLIQFIRSL